MFRDFAFGNYLDFSFARLPEKVAQTVQGGQELQIVHGAAFVGGMEETRARHNAVPSCAPATHVRVGEHQGVWGRP